MNSIINANHRCSKETDCTAAQVVLQDMLQVWSQESYLCYKVQKVPRQPNEAKEQDAGCQEVSKHEYLSALL
jgi:ribosomal 50S subunit-recycling heat shock protein